MENFTYLSDEQFAAIELAETKLVTVLADIKKVQSMILLESKKTGKTDYYKFQVIESKLQAKRVELLNIINQ